jgi:catenin alpha
LRKIISNQFCLHDGEPLEMLIQAAKAGNPVELEQRAAAFDDYARKLIDISLVACSMSKNTEGIQMIHLIIKRIEHLISQLINAAWILCSNKTADSLNNMEIFKRIWIDEVKLLTLAIDEIMSINDFLALCETYNLEDINQCIAAIREQDDGVFVQTAGRIIDRMQRVCDIVSAEMDNYESCKFTADISHKVQVLRNELLKNFVISVDNISQAIRAQPVRDLNENEFIEASHLIHEQISDIRSALLLVPQEHDEEFVYHMIDEQGGNEIAGEKHKIIIDEQTGDLQTDVHYIPQHVDEEEPHTPIVANISQEQRHVLYIYFNIYLL